jgi:multicomponent Na+:H+ antiporter subunit A
LLTSVVLSGFLMALVAPMLHRLAGDKSKWLVGLLPLVLFVFFLSKVPLVQSGGALHSSVDWIPSLNVALAFHLDGLSLLFAVLISGIGCLVTLYSGDYLKGHEHLGRWYAFLMMFMASMIGVVMADNIILLFIFWELTSLSSYFLIGFNHEEEESRAAALQALLITGMGGLAMLAGLMLLGAVGGTYSISALLQMGDRVRADTLYTPILLLVLAGAFTKSAQFPFHTWLPKAMAAPTPASAYLHSSTMVKAGIYLLARWSPVLAGTESWEILVTAFGAVTMFVGAYIAINQHILKRLLAYSTVSALGAIMMLLGLGTEHAIQAAVAFTLAHALYKAGLFLVAGSIDHESGERNIGKLGGLFRLMPGTGLAAALGGLSMAGIPLTFGFVAKEIVYETTMHAHGWVAAVLTATAVVSSMFFVVVSLCVAYRPFYGNLLETPKHPHEAPLIMWLGPVLLGCCSLFFGLAPNVAGTTLLNSAASAILNTPTTLHLVVFPGITPVLGLSVVTVLGGLAVYFLRDKLLGILRPLNMLERIGPQWGYEASLVALKSSAHHQTRVLQNGYLRYYLLTIFVTVIGLAGFVFVYQTPGLVQLLSEVSRQSLSELHFYETGLGLIILVAIVKSVYSKSRLAAITSLGVVGYGIALTFVMFGAPDLAMTMFIVETLTVILFVFTFYHLPKFTEYSSKVVLVRDIAVATTVGVFIAAMVLLSAGTEKSTEVSQYYLENSYKLAHGRNVVNVILVDFRGVDTMGEITVLGIAAVGAYALFKLKVRRKKSS